MLTNDIVLYALTACALYVAVEAAGESRDLRHEIDSATESVPVDRETGLLTAHALEPRLRGEISRSERIGSSVTIVLAATSSTDAVAAGRRLAQLAEFPQIGFRLASRVLAAAISGDERIASLDATLDELAAGCGDAIQFGRARYPEDGVTVEELLATAAARIMGSEPPSGNLVMLPPGVAA